MEWKRTGMHEYDLPISTVHVTCRVITSLFLTQRVQCHWNYRVRQKHTPLGLLRYLGQNLIFLLKIWPHCRGDNLTYIHQIWLKNIKGFRSYRLFSKKVKNKKTVLVCTVYCPSSAGVAWNRLRHERWVAYKLSGPQSTWLSCLGRDVKKYEAITPQKEAKQNSSSAMQQ